MSRNTQLSRRFFLRGLGTAMALPALEAMLPTSAMAKVGTKIPLRMGFAYVPNGAIMPEWTPNELGSQFALSPTLQPLAGVRDKLQVMGGLDHAKAAANGDGAGDHARANATFLTGCQAKKTAGADIRIGISVDQVAAAKIGHLTKLPSLELSCDKSRRSGSVIPDTVALINTIFPGKTNPCPWRRRRTPDWFSIACLAMACLEKSPKAKRAVSDMSAVFWISPLRMPIACNAN